MGKSMVKEDRIHLVLPKSDLGMLESVGISTFFLQGDYQDTISSLMMQLKQKHYKGLNRG